MGLCAQCSRRHGAVRTVQQTAWHTTACSTAWAGWYSMAPGMAYDMALGTVLPVPPCGVGTSSQGSLSAGPWQCPCRSCRLGAPADMHAISQLTCRCACHRLAHLAHTYHRPCRTASCTPYQPTSSDAPITVSHLVPSNTIVWGRQAAPPGQISAQM